MDCAEPQARTKNALVVDDGPVERLAGKVLLERLGFAVATAASGDEALKLLREQRVDLVLCDISMPGTDGLAVLEATRGQPRAPLFIMSTSYDDAEYAATSVRNGAAAYLTKPLRFDTLRATVAEVLARDDAAGH